MASIFQQQNLPAPLVAARAAAGLLGALGLATGTMALTRPSSFMAQFLGLKGLGPAEEEDDGDHTPLLVRVVGGRTLASGFGLIALAALKMDRAIGVVLCCSVIAGGVDGWAVYSYRGDYIARRGRLLEEGIASDDDEKREARKAALGHWALLGVFSVMGAWMVRVSEH